VGGVGVVSATRHDSSDLTRQPNGLYARMCIRTYTGGTIRLTKPKVECASSTYLRANLATYTYIDTGRAGTGTGTDLPGAVTNDPGSYLCVTNDTANGISISIGIGIWMKETVGRVVDISFVTILLVRDSRVLLTSISWWCVGRPRRCPD